MAHKHVTMKLDQVTEEVLEAMNLHDNIHVRPDSGVVDGDHSVAFVILRVWKGWIYSFGQSGVFVEQKGKNP